MLKHYDWPIIKVLDSFHQAISSNFSVIIMLILDTTFREFDIFILFFDVEIELY